MWMFTIEQEFAAANAGFDVLKPQPGWSDVQKRLSKANLTHARKLQVATDMQSRRIVVLKHLDFQARTYLQLVADADTADAYCNVLPLMRIEAYSGYMGVPPQLIVSSNSQETRNFDEAVRLRMTKWMHTAYCRAQTKPGGSGPRRRSSRTISRVGARILSYIDGKGETRQEFAARAGVTTRTLQTIIRTGRGRGSSVKGIAEAMDWRVEDVFPSKT